MQVVFSIHAAIRFYQRVNVKVHTNEVVDIARGFAKARTYKSDFTGEYMEAWVYKDLTNKVVLIVDKAKKLVVTVYIGGRERKALFVDECYKQWQEKCLGMATSKKGI